MSLTSFITIIKLDNTHNGQLVVTRTSERYWIRDFFSTLRIQSKNITNKAIWSDAYIATRVFAAHMIGKYDSRTNKKSPEQGILEDFCPQNII